MNTEQEDLMDSVRRSTVHQMLLWFWASPGTLVGLIAGAVAIVSGGKMRRVGPTLEFWGGGVTWLLQTRLIRARGMTLGHVVVGISPDTLDTVRPHEWVHVRQCERWGPFFLPAYLGSSLFLWIRGRHPYWDNPFEVEAFAEDLKRSKRTEGAGDFV